MGAELTSDQLQRAAENLGRIERFLRQRSRWHTSPATVATLVTVDRAAARIAHALEPHLTAPQTRATDDPAHAVDPLPAAEFEVARLDKMAVFLDQLGDWFAARTAGPVAEGGLQHLEEACGAVLGIRHVVAAILAGQQAVGEPAVAAGPASTAPQVANPAAARDHAAPGRREEIGVPSPPRPSNAVSRTERLILEDTEETPLLQTFKDQTELTPHARELLTRFLESADLSYAGYQRTKFDADVEHRLQIMPPGQVLVIKVGEYGGAPKPYFSYVPKHREPDPPEE